MDVYQEKFEKLKPTIENLFATILSNKSLEATYREEPGYDKLIQEEILVPYEGRFKLNFNNISCYWLSTMLLGERQLTVDLTALESIVSVAKQTLRAAREKEILQGRTEFGKALIKFLVVEAYESGNNLNTNILALKKDQNDFYLLVPPLALAIPYLNQSVETAYEMFDNLWKQTINDGVSTDVATSLKKYSKTEGPALAELIIRESNKTSGFASLVLNGFYEKDDKEIWHLVEEFLKHGFQSEVIKAITNFNFSNAEDVIKAVEVANRVELPPENQWQLVYLNVSLLNCKYSNDDIQQSARESLQALGKVNDKQVRLNLIHELRYLKNHDEDKLAIVLNLDLKDEDIYNGLNFLIEDFVPLNYFQVIIEMIRQLKTQFDPDDIDYSLSSVLGKHPVEFSNELIKILVHEEGLIRFCASRLLQELNKHARFTFSVDLLLLSERDQIRIIDTVLFDFIHPEKVIPYLLIFKNSQRKKVLQFLAKSLLQLISDYSNNVLDAIRGLLDPQQEVDQKLLQFCERAYEELVELIKRKHALEEFKPHKNSSRAFNLFERLYRKTMSQQVGEGHNDYMKNSPLFSMVHQVQIVRGKSWRIESKGGEPDELSEFSVGMSLPRTFLMNPDGYNYAMRVKIASKYIN